jgi:hypothetical protein
MTEPRTTPMRNVRMSDDLWQQLGDAAKLGGKTRSAVLVELARWYVEDYGQPAMPRLPIPPRPPAE